MENLISTVISVVAITLSLITAWLTLFRRGNIKMTQPTVIFFGPDGSKGKNGRCSNKVFLRALLYATSKRGRIIESMYVRLRRGETTQNFNIWVYGDEALNRGSGLFVGENGIACNHHFLLPEDGCEFQFCSGEYKVEVFARIVGNRHDTLLFSVVLRVTDQISEPLLLSEAGVYFDWGPDSHNYHAHVATRPAEKLPKQLIETLEALRTIN
jgi:hypothetical protein